jgi:hypothetical protein
MLRGMYVYMTRPPPWNYSPGNQYALNVEYSNGVKQAWNIPAN